MDKRTFGEEVTKELVGKAVVWGPAIAGGTVAGPFGFFAGAAIGIAIVVFGGSGSAPPVGGDPPKE